MATRIQHRRSSLAGNIPDPGDLQVGEISVNFGDRYIYTKNGANAVIKMNGFIPLELPADVTAGDSYIDTDTGKLNVYFGLNGDPDAWHEIAPPEDLTSFIKRDGSISMTGQLNLIGGAVGNEAIGYTQTTTLIASAVADYVKKDGSVAMTGRLTLFSSNPVSNLEAASKEYVDDQVAIATPDLDAYLAKVGGVMTGQITLPGGGTGNQAATANEIAAGFAAHVALPDPHTQYATNTELTNHKNTGNTEHPLVTGSVHGFMSSTDKTRFDTMTVAADADVTAGTDNAKYITPLRLDTFLDPILRRRLTANITFYVRTDGSDSNTGLVNNAGGAFLTIQHADDVAAALDFNGFAVTIQVGDGTYTGSTTINKKTGQIDVTKYTIQGNSSTPGNVVISTTSSACFEAGHASYVMIKDMELRTTTSGNCITAGTLAQVSTGALRFGACAGFHMSALDNALILVTQDYSIVGNAVIHLDCHSGVIRFSPSLTVTLTGTPAFSTRFAFAIGPGAIIGIPATTTFTGAATGQRYNASLGGAINVNFSSTSFLPGNSAGAGTDFHTSPFGWYH